MTLLMRTVKDSALVLSQLPQKVLLLVLTLCFSVSSPQHVQLHTTPLIAHLLPCHITVQTGVLR